MLFKNENKGDEMVDIMSHLHQYVPAVEYTKDFVITGINVVHVATLKQATMHSILLRGDQLTASRARGARKARVNSDSPLSRFEGLIPCAEDWHAKMYILARGMLTLLLIVQSSAIY